MAADGDRVRSSDPSTANIILVSADIDPAFVETIATNVATGDDSYQIVNLNGVPVGSNYHIDLEGSTTSGDVLAESGNFTVSNSTGSDSSSPANANPISPQKGGLSGAAKGGIGAGVAVVVLIILAVGYCFYRRRKAGRSPQQEIKGDRIPELDAKGVACAEAVNENVVQELETSAPKRPRTTERALPELETKEATYEKDAGSSSRARGQEIAPDVPKHPVVGERTRVGSLERRSEHIQLSNEQGEVGPSQTRQNAVAGRTSPQPDSTIENDDQGTEIEELEEAERELTFSIAEAETLLKLRQEREAIRERLRIAKGKMRSGTSTLIVP